MQSSLPSRGLAPAHRGQAWSASFLPYPPPQRHYRSNPRLYKTPNASCALCVSRECMTSPCARSHATLAVASLVEFTPHCVSNFERRYHQRITSSTVNSLFVIGNTSLLFYARSDAAAAFEVPALMNGSSTLPVLRVGDCAIFDQDQVESHRRFPLVQEHPRFVQSLDMAMQGSVLSRYT